MSGFKLNKANVVIIGPGLGTSKWSKMLFYTVLESSLPMIIDADALNIIAKDKLITTSINKIQHIFSNCIFTPHPGEAARLLGTTTNEIQADRFNSVIKLQKYLKGICVLKGSGTLIASSKKVNICDAGNPGMASGGMGDILSGIIGGLVAQGLNLFDAAHLGVLLHAVAGDKVAAKDGKIGMLALDLLPIIRKLINSKTYII